MPAAFAAAVFLLASAVHAQANGPSGYVTDSGGSVVRNAAYYCWHTGYWSPAAAIAECDPDLVAKPKPAASAPAPSREASVPAKAPAAGTEKASAKRR
jgi:OOP family OmpA-OmpF porin